MVSYYSYVNATKIWSFTWGGQQHRRRTNASPPWPSFRQSKHVSKNVGYSQLNDAVVQRGAYPRPDRVEGEALHPCGFALELGEHREVCVCAFVVVVARFFTQEIWGAPANRTPRAPAPPIPTTTKRQKNDMSTMTMSGE